ncbi:MULTISPECIES: type III pantothenate kinase [Candidatus Neomicrothrix]|jgi:type III pantothenate kinase|uniref:Type III pantothenate kinase n=1 Tax=Candidatus Neomicrothrix parvicella RN1 TaxID=1229780 RepID=R4Z1B3_9ACTN|nr:MULTISPECIES: type III pantothenate kinase [Microthrix]NLH66633.1 type III pantothenate kinase [Candidatus Microthrix parvicella]MBK6503729.1 type III pantothenate kinase [Candidatus Microthrix sp.]MBK7019559.1 type III pantothenate kinase [Candidatus Microthrix sp.]MBK7324525.1 type III pantothenate kinase [Candidatus Microthrix sp.]MBL0204711.1 type III pantothenate kinase [Candidatus Microthrix sp.]
MLLTIDVGNTQTVVGLYRTAPEHNADVVSGTPSSGADDSDLVDHWRISTDVDRTSDELAMVLRQLLESAEDVLDDEIELHGIAISSGVPFVTGELRQMCEHRFGIEPVVVGPGVKTGLPIRYDNPAEVGADRVANAVGALDRYGGPTVVVDFGTATTFDVISADGAYLGGAIIPGVEVSLDALFGRAAGLRRVELVPPRSVVGRTTMESVQSGVLYGTAAMVDGMIKRIVDELGGSATIVATGGLADVIVPHAANVDQLDPWITLHGLRLIWEKNQ